VAVVAIALLELHLPEAASLKDKRRVVKSLVDRVHQRYRVSIAETAFHDLHQRAELGIAIVSHSESNGERVLETVRGTFEEAPEAYVIRWTTEIVDLQ
jgi:hypothetical protein